MSLLKIAVLTNSVHESDKQIVPGINLLRQDICIGRI